MKTVDEVLSEWSEEEREQLKDLIEECREREKELIENSRRSEENVNKLTDSLASFFSNSCKIKEAADKIGDTMLGIYLRLYRKKMPAA
jgi:predicted nuclease with TOPRIM domain